MELVGWNMLSIILITAKSMKESIQWRFIHAKKCTFTKPMNEMIRTASLSMYSFLNCKLVHSNAFHLCCSAVFTSRPVGKIAHRSFSDISPPSDIATINSLITLPNPGTLTY